MEKYMLEAFKEAKKCKKTDDVPVGAVIVENNKIIAKSHNTKEKTKIVINHAEIIAVEKACKKKKTWYLNNCIMYVTLEPCPMCLEVIKNSRMKKIVYATPRTEKTELKSPIIEKGNGQKQAEQQLKDFFKTKRQQLK